MPEGDTLHKIARAMAPHLDGRLLERIELRGRDASLSGHFVRHVRARGKNLLIELDNGLVLRSHLGLHGSWHRYAPNERWRRPSWQASLTLQTAGDVFVCFNAKDVDVTDARKLSLHPVVGQLGPDLLEENVDFDLILRRAHTNVRQDDFVVDLLLNQSVASGIGNVYKNEVLFLCRLFPGTPAALLPDTKLRQLFQAAWKLMRANLGGGIRRTTDERSTGRARYWIYERGGKGCFVCRETIQYDRMGRKLRSTYWCPRCQPSEWNHL